MDYKRYRDRRNQLQKKVLASCDRSADEKSIIAIWGDFDRHCCPFQQEPSCYYFTGIREPGIVCLIKDDKHILYIPQYQKSRSHWVTEDPILHATDPSVYGFDAIVYAGDVIPGHHVTYQFSPESYAAVLHELRDAMRENFSIFCTGCSSVSSDSAQLSFAQFARQLPQLIEACDDISYEIMQLRRFKSQDELDCILHAIEITVDAHEAAVSAIVDGVDEAQVHAAAEYIMLASEARPAFPTIVASGLCATTLHYTCNDRLMKNGELVIVDMGARYNGYCADVTRTYPVGQINLEAQQLYKIVAEAHAYLGSIVGPGYYLYHDDNQDLSLYHLMIEFFKKHDLASYVRHSVGHYIGLEVHEAVARNLPLQEGDVITIEPGIYLPHKNSGIRIEDMYYITDAGAVCLTNELPYDLPGIQALSQKSLDT